MKLYTFFTILSFLLTGCLGVPETNETPVKTLIGNNNSKNVFFQSQNWWENSNSSQLDTLITEVLKNNSDIKIAKLNIQKAIYTLNSVKNSNISSVDLSGGWNRTHVLNSHVKTDNPIGDLKKSNNIDMGNLSIQGQYVFDIWGKFEALENQGEYSKLATQLQSEWSTLTLSTNVANLYGKYILLTKENQILEKKLNIAKEILSFQKILYNTGLGNKENILSADNNINSISQKISEIKTQKISLKNTFYTLSGSVKSEKINSILIDIDKNTPEFSYFLSIPEYIDSDIVVNRTDIKYYLALINSQRENLKSLKADFYPSFSITGKYEYQNIRIQDFLKAHSNILQFGPSLYLPLFNRNTLVQNYNIGGVDLNIFIENYNNNLIKAYQDVNNNLSSLKTANQNNLLEKNNLTNSKVTYNDQNTLFKIGSISKMELLNYENNLLDTELSYIENNFSLYTNQINLIGSLGGYYKNEVK
ncbi:TolC family protein [Candidatus Cetobacterium colombiensis]|uniref:TolC family protein n=1 Tax=Candidatus Cetobacterium colombiensis TaxID=3073100 RepID=A0ABU4W6M3_9FUSO|nr:TolC family protein [Candidatus Cetobacterium colombiensis]MDX8335178.1 TolC family protein [Candidatus Cetobacterium colombiensis]